MTNNTFIVSITIISFLTLGWKPSFAQQVTYTYRDNIMLATLNQLHARERAINQAVKETRVLRVEKKGPERIKKIGAYLKRIGSTSHPYLNFSINHNDNIDSTTKNKSDIAYQITPGVKANFDINRTPVNLDMHMDNAYLHHHSGNNSHVLDANFYTNEAIGDYLITFSEDFLTNYLASNPLGIRRNRTTFFWRNTINPKISRNFNRLGFDLGYKRSENIFETDYTADNSVEEMVDFSQYFRITSKTRIFYEQVYSRTKLPHVPSDASYSSYNDYILGLTGLLSSKISASLKMNYKLYDSKTDISDYRETTWSGSLGYNLSKRTNLNFQIIHLVHALSENADTYYEDYMSIGGNHRLAFNPKFNLSLSLSRDKFAYPKGVSFYKKKVINTWGVSLNYAFRIWMDCGFAYSYRTQDANADTTYHANSIAFSTNFKF